MQAQNDPNPELLSVSCPYCKKPFSARRPGKPAKGSCLACRKEVVLLPEGTVIPAAWFDLAEWKESQKPERTTSASVPLPVAAEPTPPVSLETSSPVQVRPPSALFVWGGMAFGALFIVGGMVLGYDVLDPLEYESNVFEQGTSDRVCMEAEHLFEGWYGVDSYKRPPLPSLSHASGGKAVETIEKSGGSWWVNFTQTGLYFVWIRVAGVHDGADSTTFENVTELEDILLEVGPVETSFRWLHYSPGQDKRRMCCWVSSKGPQEFHIRVASGLRVDKILFTLDESYIPMDEGPEESPCRCH